MSARQINDLFQLNGKVAVITGGGGLLGFHHAAAVAGCGGVPVLLDIDPDGLRRVQARLEAETGKRVMAQPCDITRLPEVEEAARAVVDEHGGVDILINNAARNPKVERNGSTEFSRLENFPLDQWELDLAVGLGGAFNCARVFGSMMAQADRGGVIINIASDLGVIAPDQRLYRSDHLEPQMQPVKPVTYSVVKHGLIGLTKYLATYWCEQGIRCNSLSPGGVYVDQDEVFVNRISKLIPLGRMAKEDEYRGAIAFLCSDASAYMNGANLVMDGGRTIW